jgi:hypothetical protein
VTVAALKSEAWEVEEELLQKFLPSLAGLF